MLLKKNKVIFIFSTSFLLFSCHKKDNLTEINLVTGLNTKKITFDYNPNFSFETKSRVKSFDITVYRQKYHNKEIIGSYLKQVFNQKGDLVGLVGLTTELKANKNLTKLFEAKDLSLVLSEIQNKYPELKNTPVQHFDWNYFASFNSLHPVYQLLYSTPASDIFEIHLDHKLNIVSKQKKGSSFSDAEAVVFPRGPKRSQLENVLLKNIELENGIKTPLFKISSAQTSKYSSPLELIKISPEDSRFDELQVTYYLQKSFEWFTTTFEAKIPFMLDVQVHVGSPEKSNTAFYYANKIRFGSGDDVVYSQIPRDPSIIIHESNHAIIDNLAHLPFDKEGGSINEGLADFLTTLQLNSPNLGEVSFLKGPYRRTVKNELRFSDKKGLLYGDSAIISGLLWNLKEALGDLTAGRIAVNTLVLLGPTSDFLDFKNKIQFVIKSELSDKNLEIAQKILKNRNWL